jgi:hypothetical protein
MASETPLARRVWRTWSDIAELFDGPEDPGWIVDQDRVAHDVCGPASDH